MSMLTGPSEGSTLARTKSGPMVNSGWGWEAMKTWARAVPGQHARARAISASPGARRIIASPLLDFPGRVP